MGVMKGTRTAYKNSMVTALVFLAVFSAGYFLGKGAGAGLMSSLLTGGGRLVLLLYMPSARYLETIGYLDSGNELTRLAGYYSLLDNKKLDADFIIDRYREEKSVFVKRTLVWLMGFAADDGKIFDVFVDTYGSADGSVKREMIRTLKRKDTAMLEMFLKDKGITDPEPDAR